MRFARGLVSVPRIFLEERRTMTFGRVFTVWDYYDGPRTGIAEHDGRPHYYARELDDDDEHAETFILRPIDDETLDLALRHWNIWCGWQLAFHRGEKDHSSHPATPGQNSAYAQLESRLEEKIAESAGEPIRASASFRVVPGQESLSRGMLRNLEVEWTPRGPAI
jgi:hypothetical protein